MIYPNDITNLKTDIGEKVGQKIIVKGSLGRNRPFEKEATLEKVDDKILVTFKEPVRAITKGQSVVFYDQNNICLGGGIIEKVL